MSEIRFSCGSLESSNAQEQTERERKFQWEPYWPRIILICQFCVILQASMISADDLQTRNTTKILSGHVSTIILMRGPSDSKYKGICLNRAFTITQTRKI